MEEVSSLEIMVDSNWSWYHIPELCNLHAGLGAHPKGGGGLPVCIPHQTPENRNLKNTDFVDIMVSNVLRNLPFSRNQPLKSADD
jgi:hypothetical protein